MTNDSPRAKPETVILAVAGGPDSIYLLRHGINKSFDLVLGHFNHGVRGIDSDEDKRFVERFCRETGIRLEVRKGKHPTGSPTDPKKETTKYPDGFEAKAREERYAFLQDLKKKYGAKAILLAHTSDDQVETVLMRVLEGAGISGLKGIPRQTEDGIERPLLSTWREGILRYLKQHKIPFRV